MNRFSEHAGERAQMQLLLSQGPPENHSELSVEVGFQVFCGNHPIRRVHLKTQSQSCRTGESCSVISSEFLDAFAREFLLYVKRFPRWFQVKLLVGV